MSCDMSVDGVSGGPVSAGREEFVKRVSLILAFWGARVHQVTRTVRHRTVKVLGIS